LDQRLPLLGTLNFLAVEGNAIQDFYGEENQDAVTLADLQ